MTQPEPMSRDQYAAALADLDEHIKHVDVETGSPFSDPADRLAYVISNLTEATLAVAKGVRLLAEPPPVETRTGSFTLIETPEDKG